MDEEETLLAFGEVAERSVPEGGVLEGFVCVVAYLDSKTGETDLQLSYNHDQPYHSTVGLLEKAKFSLMYDMEVRED